MQYKMWRKYDDHIWLSLHICEEDNCIMHTYMRTYSLVIINESHIVNIVQHLYCGAACWNIERLCFVSNQALKFTFTLDFNIHLVPLHAPCGLRGCKNGPAPFPGRMSHKATKPGLVSVLYLSMFFIVLLFIRAPFYVLLVFIVCVLSFGCSN